MPRCLIEACAHPATRCIPYCSDTAIGEYFPGKGEDVWLCDDHYTGTYGDMTIDETIAFCREFIAPIFEKEIA